jgi:carboxypeptidase PM20D1
VLVPGATDSRFFAPIAENIYRFQPIVLTEAEAKTFHGANERISVENLGRIIRFYDLLIVSGAGEAQ